MRIEIKKESNSESYSLTNLRKWTFSNPITSVLIFDFFNHFHETLNIQGTKGGSGSKQGSNEKQGSGIKHVKSYSNVTTMSSGTLSRTIHFGSGANNIGDQSLQAYQTEKRRKSSNP
jgi:hypothetical protein